MKKKILVDLSATILHHGHIRLLKKASRLGKVTVALTTDKGVREYKKYTPELEFKYRKEIIESIKYVSKVIQSNWKITNNFLKRNKIDILIRGDDYKNEKFIIKTIIYPRTKNISSTIIRERACKILKMLKKT